MARQPSTFAAGASALGALLILHVSWTLLRPPVVFSSWVQDGGLPPAVPPSTAIAFGWPLDVTVADVAQWEALPGVGPRRAELLASRGRAGALRCVDDLLQIHGIGPKMARRLSTRLRFPSSGCPQEEP